MACPYNTAVICRNMAMLCTFWLFLNPNQKDQLMHLQVTPSTDTETLIDLLHDAEEGDDRIRAALSHPHSAAYLASMDAAYIGAALMHWDIEESELVYIAVQKAHQG